MHFGHRCTWDQHTFKTIVADTGYTARINWHLVAFKSTLRPNCTNRTIEVAELPNL